MELTIAEMAKILGYTGNYPQTKINGFAYDSREVTHGDAFFCLVGETVDGHDFAKQAVESGASVVVSQNPLNLPIPNIVYYQTEEALILLSREYTKKFGIDIVGVTGSAGKTTTKELCASLLSKRYKTAKNDGNRNTPIGLPSSLKNISNDTEIFVAEMSGSWPEEINTILRIFTPRVDIVTNVGFSHLEALGSIEGVAKTKGDLIRALPVGGIAILNADDPRVAAMADLTRCRKVTYGTNEHALVKGSMDGDIISVRAYGQVQTFRPKLASVHFLYDSLAAIACALEFGLTLGECAIGCEEFEPVEGRGQVIETKQGYFIIDESYNANPVSMKETLKMLSGKPGRRFAVIGDMLELGIDTEKLHAELGRFLSELRLDGVYCYGNLSRLTSNEVKPSLHFESKQELVASLKTRLQKGDWVLVKGSNGMGMKEVVKRLKEE
jgi:UDP-N-acetylmuramoyl-tripeptide--D-alanyl-D-alanine ligase